MEGRFAQVVPEGHRGEDSGDVREVPWFARPVIEEEEEMYPTLPLKMRIKKQDLRAMKRPILPQGETVGFKALDFI